MAKPRNVTVFTWDGPVVVQRLGRADPDPSAETLERISAEWSSRAGGVLPSVRVIERAPSLGGATGVGAAGGTAGSLPDRR